MDTIIVGVDGSDTAAQAARIAAELAASVGAKLHIVTAYHRGGRSPEGAATGLHPLDEAENVLSIAAADARTLKVEVTTSAVDGKPAEVMCDEAARVKADVIVVGNRHVQGAARVLGAVATRIVSHAPCDVYIAKTT